MVIFTNFLGNKHLDDEDEDDDLSDNNVGSILDEDSAIVHVEGENFYYLCKKIRTYVLGKSL